MAETVAVVSLMMIFLLTPIDLVLGFSPPNTTYVLSDRSHKTSTRLFGTIRFVGTANAQHFTPPIDSNGENKSLTAFLTTSSDSIASLLGTEISRCRKIEDKEESGMTDVWECRQATVGWFGMKISPVFISQIEKNPAEETVIISIIDAMTEVEDGGRFGNTFVSAMKRSKFEGRNIVTWKEDDNTADQIYSLEGSLTLTLTINLPPFLPMPPGFGTIGSKIVERTCRDRLKLSLQNVSDAYIQWTTLDN